MRTTSPFLFAALVSLPLAAQDKADPFRFVPADAQLVVRIPSPAKARAMFAGTSMQKLWDSAAGRRLVVPAKAALEEMIEKARKEEPRAAEFLDAILNEWAGDLVLGVRVDLAGLMSDDDEAPPYVASVTLTSDGKIDLATHAAALAELAEEESSEQKLDLEAGGHTFRAARDGTGDVFTFPQAIDGNLVLFVGSDLEKDLASFAGSDARFQSAGAESQRAMSAHVSVDLLAKAMRAGLVEALEGAPFDVDKLFTAFGLDALTAFELSVAPHGEHVGLDMTMAFGDGPRGIFGIAATEPSSKKLLRLLPADADMFSVGRLPIGPLVDWVGGLVDEVSPATGMDWKTAQDAFAEECKVRLVEDLVAHLGSEMLMVQDMKAQMEQIAADEDADEVSAAFAGTCVGMELRDGKAFGASLEKLLRSRGLHAARKSEDYQGTKIYRLNLAGMLEVEYAVTDDLLLVGGGSSEASRRSLRAVLDQRAQPAEGDLPAALAAKLSKLPDGWSSFGVSSLSSILDAASTVATTAAAQMPAGRGGRAQADVAEGMKGLSTELRRLGLESMYSAFFVTKGRMEIRYLW